MAEKMFDGFDHTQYKDEVEQRWGKDCSTKSDHWYRSLSQDQKDDFMIAAAELGADWADAAQGSVAIDSDEALALAKRLGPPGVESGRGTHQYEWRGRFLCQHDALAAERMFHLAPRQ